jgi:hypothetical protein
MTLLPGSTSDLPIVTSTRQFVPFPQRTRPLSPNPFLHGVNGVGTDFFLEDIV